MQIRRLDKSHVAEVAELERLCFSRPWSQKSLEFLMTDAAVGFVAICDGRVAAYGGMMCVLDEGQITNIATHPDFRRRGFAAAVTDALIGYARENGICSVSLEVRESNLAAIALYERLGFVTVGKRPRFYSDPTEDALLMEVRI
jgi:ribosomal-protein-alanine N-acetyltransferase